MNHEKAEKKIIAVFLIDDFIEYLGPECLGNKLNSSIEFILSNGYADDKPLI